MSNEPVRRVGFDQRLQYYENLKEIMLLAKKAAITGELRIRHRAVKQVFFMVGAYITPDGKAAISELLKNAGQKLGSAAMRDKGFKNALLSDVDRLLDDAEELIHEHAREIFLPVGGQHEDEVDWEKIMRES